MRGRERKSRPGLFEQLLVTAKILLVTGFVFAGIWLLDRMVSD